MRACVISDVHGNLHALEAVLEAIAREEPDEIWCLGDLVGYGPRPNACCRLVAERADVCLVGNHDLATIGELDLDVFSPDAAAVARWTASCLAPDAEEFLRTLHPSGRRHEIGLYHGSPRDPVWEYVLSADVAMAALREAPERVVLVGHSHVALAFDQVGPWADGDVAPEGREVDLDAGEGWLLNPGSVGQPRDGDPRAAYLLLDVDARRATFRRVSYDIAATQGELRERGLPEALALRLEHGL
jgi:predicted phosphodiesterase